MGFNITDYQSAHYESSLSKKDQHPLLFGSGLIIHVEAILTNMVSGAGVQRIDSFLPPPVLNTEHRTLEP